jgi:anti-anti-sigma regulatory factor
VSDHYLSKATREGNVTVVRIFEELDQSNVGWFEGALEVQGPLVLDLSECRHLDSSALACIAQTRLRRDDAFPIVAPAGSPAYRLLAIMLFDKVFPVCESVSEAAGRVAQTHGVTRG